MKHVLISLFNTVVLTIFWIVSYNNPVLLGFYITAVGIYLLLSNTGRLHLRHKHLSIKSNIANDLFHIWRLNVYSVILPWLFWISVTILLTWFSGIRLTVMFFIAVVTLFGILLIHDHYFEHLKLDTHVFAILESITKFVAFFYIMLVLYGYLYLYESDVFINDYVYFWLVLIASALMMWQAHHKHTKHTLQSGTLIILFSWIIAAYAWSMYFIHLPHVYGALMVAIAYSICWSIFTHIQKKTLKKHYLLENIGLFILINVIVITMGNFGQIL